MNGTLSLRQVAEEIGKHPETVRRYLNRGIIRARKSAGAGGDWIVTRKALDEYLNDDYDPRAGR